MKPRVEVKLHLDFLELGAVGQIEVGPRCRAAADDRQAVPTIPNLAALPHNYVPEAQHRIEFYRKLSQATDKAALETLQKELRDRVGPLPPPVELLLAVTELKILASEKSVTSIEVEEDKLKLVRLGDLLMSQGKFPRLAKKDTKAKVKEIKRVLLAM